MTTNLTLDVLKAAMKYKDCPEQIMMLINDFSEAETALTQTGKINTLKILLNEIESKEILEFGLCYESRELEKVNKINRIQANYILFVIYLYASVHGIKDVYLWPTTKIQPRVDFLNGEIQRLERQIK